MKKVKGKAVFSAPGDYIYFKSQVPLHKIPVGLKQWRYYDFGPRVVPPLVCIPGTAGSADVYYKQVMALSMKGYRVISIDIPRVWSHDEWIHAFEKFLDAIDVHHVNSVQKNRFFVTQMHNEKGSLYLFKNMRATVENKVVVGHLAEIHIYGTLLGGFLAQLFAQHRPRRVKSLVLSNTFLNTHTFAASMPWAPVVSWAPSFLLKRYVLTGIRDGPHEPFIADSVDFVVAQVEAISKDDLASRLTLTVDSAAVAPLLLSDACITIMDTDDYCAVPQQLKDEVSERYPGARRASLKSGGDFPFLSRPDEINLHLQLHLRRVGLEPRPDLVRGASNSADAGNPHNKGKRREFDDHLSEDAEGSSSNLSNSNDDYPRIKDEQEVNDWRKADKDSCKGPLGNNEKEDKDDPHGDDRGNSRGPAKGNEAENTDKLCRDEAETSQDSSKNEESKNSNDAPKDLVGPSWSNLHGPGNIAACFLNQDLQKLSAARIFSEFSLVLLYYVLLAYTRALYITCVRSCRYR